MCGIVGYVGDKESAPILVSGLKKLEYRGYDSAGIAVLGPEGLQVRRAAGRIKGLEALMREKPLTGSIGVGHTRWATHGRPTDENAHPHTDHSGNLVVVHNGIIENYLPIKERLIAEGHVFKSETDTEVVAHLLEEEVASHAGRCASCAGPMPSWCWPGARRSGWWRPSTAPAAWWWGSAPARPISPPTFPRCWRIRGTW